LEAELRSQGEGFVAAACGRKIEQLSEAISTSGSMTAISSSALAGDLGGVG